MCRSSGKKLFCEDKNPDMIQSLQLQSHPNPKVKSPDLSDVNRQRLEENATIKERNKERGLKGRREG